MNAKLEHSLIKHGFVYVVVRNLHTSDTEIDVFSTHEAAKEHFDRYMASSADRDAMMREEPVMVESYLDEDGE